MNSKHYYDSELRKGPTNETPAPPATEAEAVAEADWWIVLTEMGYVIFHGADKDRAERVAVIHDRKAEPLFRAPPKPDKGVVGDMVMVPREPTVEMSAAGMRCIKDIQPNHFHKYAAGIANSVYEKMLAASTCQSDGGAK